MDANKDLNSDQCEQVLTAYIDQLHKNSYIDINSMPFAKNVLGILADNYQDPSEHEQHPCWAGLSKAWFTLRSTEIERSAYNIIDLDEFCTINDPSCKNPTPSNSAGQTHPTLHYKANTSEIISFIVLMICLKQLLTAVADLLSHKKSINHNSKDQLSWAFYNGQKHTEQLTQKRPDNGKLLFG